MCFADTPPTVVQGCPLHPCVAQKIKEDTLAEGAGHALKRIVGEPMDMDPTGKPTMARVSYMQFATDPAPCRQMAFNILKQGTLDRFNRYRQALPSAYAAEDMNKLGDKKDDQESQEQRLRGKCLTRLPDSAEGLSQELMLLPGTIQDKDLRDDATGFRAGLYRSKTDGQLILVPRDTEPNALVDWQTNTDNGDGLDTRQYKAMRDLTKKLDKRGVNFDLAGYSKGAGQAQFGGLFATNAQVRIFNSAGLPESALEGTGQSSFAPLAARTRAFNAEGEFLTYMNKTTDPGKQIACARFLRTELAGEGEGVNPINIAYRNPATKEAMEEYKIFGFGPDPDPGFAQAKADYLQGLDDKIAAAEAKMARGEGFRLFPPARAGQEEDLPNSMSAAGELFGAGKDEPNLGKLIQHQIGNVVTGLEKTKAADQKILEQFTARCPED